MLPIIRFTAICIGLSAVLSMPTLADEHKPFEHHMYLNSEANVEGGIALTLDACSGGVDYRILDVLVEERIPTTVFVTARWLVRNEEAFNIFLAHPDLFQIEGHGAEHIPPVLGTEKVYGITPAGTPERIVAEVTGGSDALVAAGAPRGKWYRGATALYSPAAVPLIESTGFRIAGFSLNADYGASASAEVARKQIASAKEGDVIIAHINQPKRAAGEGIAQGILDLKARGVNFVLLDDVPVTDAQ